MSNYELARVVKQEIQDQIGALRFVEFAEVKVTYLLENGGYTAEVLFPGAATTSIPFDCIAAYVPQVGDWAVLLHPPGCDPMLIGAAPARSNTVTEPGTGVFAPIAHNHDGVYAPFTHNHDDRYYTESEINDFLAALAAAAQPSITYPGSLSGSWGAAASPYDPPGYYKSTTGRVHLSGAMTGGTIGSAAFTLPTGSRPGARVIQNVYSLDGTGQVLAAVQIDTSGVVTPISGGNVLFSLDGVSFRPA